MHNKRCSLTIKLTSLKSISVFDEKPSALINQAKVEVETAWRCGMKGVTSWRIDLNNTIRLRGWYNIQAFLLLLIFPYLCFVVGEVFLFSGDKVFTVRLCIVGWLVIEGDLQDVQYITKKSQLPLQQIEQSRQSSLPTEASTLDINGILDFH